LNWILDNLSDGREAGKIMLGMMHHGLIEHFPGQKALFPEYVIDSWETLWPQFAEHGLPVMFTGHFHAQDIVKMDQNDSFIFDIETGSLVTYPCPYRSIQVDLNGILTIQSQRILSASVDAGERTFQDYAKDFLKTGMDQFVYELLMDRFGVDSTDAADWAPYMADAFIAHLEGDEQLTAEAAAFASDLLSSDDVFSRVVGAAIEAVYTDPEPADNDLIIDLHSGEIL
jgi:hypothetical protein